VNDERWDAAVPALRPRDILDNSSERSAWQLCAAGSFLEVRKNVAVQGKRSTNQTPEDRLRPLPLRQMWWTWSRRRKDVPPRPTSVVWAL